MSWCKCGSNMATAGRSFLVLTLCVLLLPAVIGTQSEVRECAFFDHLQPQGAESANELRGVVGENGTIHCSHGSLCFGLWEKKSDGEVVLVKQGCWTSQPECLSERCLVTDTPAHIQNGSYRFCCCSRDLCNANFREAPPTAPPPVLRHTDGRPLRRQETAVIAIVTVAVAAVLIALLFFGYRVIRGKQKLSMSTLNVMETTNASYVDMDTLKLLELIGQGRYGSVYRGSLNERSVAVKVFSSANRQNYANEHSIYSLPLLQQQHNIAHFLLADERTNSDGCTEFLIVMDYYPHGCLLNFLSHSSVDWTSCCRMMHGVTRGLAFLHSEIQAGDEYKPAVAHRDISSRNVLVRSDLSCVLADFGLSMKLTGNRSCRHGDEDNMAISEVGTVRYMAPEVLGGALNLREYQTALKQVDVYALGLLYWESFRRCQDLFHGEEVPDYQLPFQMELGKQPSFEDMQVLVVREKYRPCFPPSWRDNSLALRLLKETVEDCWDQDAEARLSAQCAEERLSELSMLSVHTLHKHRNVSNGCWPPTGPAPSITEAVTVGVTKDFQDQSVTSSRRAEGAQRKCIDLEQQQLQKCSSENIIQTARRSVLCSAAQPTAHSHRGLSGLGLTDDSCGAVPGVSVCLSLDPAEVSAGQVGPRGAAGAVQVLPQRPSSLQLLSTGSERRPVPPRVRQGRQQASSTQVETGVAKMNAVAVLAAPEPFTAATVTNRSAVMLVANGSSAGVPTLVTNSLIVRGQTNRAGPLPEEHLSSRNCDNMAAVDQELGLNLISSPDEHQPLLKNELPPARAHFLSAQRSNSNNNNNRSSTAHKTGFFNNIGLESTSHNSVLVIKQQSDAEPTETLSLSQPTHPFEEISNENADREAPLHKLLNNKTTGELIQHWKAPCVQSDHSELTQSCSDKVKKSTFKSQESSVVLNLISDPTQQPSQTCSTSRAESSHSDKHWNMESNDLQSSEDIDFTKSPNTACVEKQEAEVIPGFVQALSWFSSLGPDAPSKGAEKSSERSAGVSQSPVTAADLPAHAAASVPDVLRKFEFLSDLAQTTAGPDKPRRPARPSSLDLSSPSAFPDGAPLTDTGLSASGEKIKRRVKTPYTVKKWRPASWVLPAEASTDFKSPFNAPKINQSKSSMAVFLVGGGATATATSEPDGVTSF